MFSAPVRVANAERSPVSDQVVYERRDPAGRSQIFVLEYDGTERRLTDLSGGAFEPTWIARWQRSRSRQHGPRRGHRHLRDGRGRQPIQRLVGTARPDGSPDWSPDGARIVFHTRRAMLVEQDIFCCPGQISVVTIRTRALSVLDGNRFSMRGSILNGRQMVDGSRSSLSTQIVNGRVVATNLSVIRPDGSQERRVVRWGRQIENPSWSPDGGSIVMEVNDPASSGIRLDWTQAVATSRSSACERGDSDGSRESHRSIRPAMAPTRRSISQAGVPTGSS